MRTRVEIEKALTDAARTIAPFDKGLGRRTLHVPEAELLIKVAGMFHEREEAADTVPDQSDPPWLVEARRQIGQGEIPGPRHNSFISKGWGRLGAGWFNDDETPWCGFFVAHCIEAAGLPYPGRGQFARAKAWLDWGKSCPAVYGAVVVFGRDGGGHVGFLVGQNASNYYVLGGNQSNAVNITPIAKSRALGTRWPLSIPLVNRALPQMSGGAVSRNER